MQPKTNDPVMSALRTMFKKGECDVFRVYLKGEGSRMEPQQPFYCTPGRHTEETVKSYVLSTQFTGINPESVCIIVKKAKRL